MKPQRPTARISPHWILTALALGGCAISHVPNGDAGPPDVSVAEAGDVVVDGMDARPDGDGGRDADAGDARDVTDVPDVFTCGDGSTTCNGACVDLQNDPRHCGACATDCTALAGVRPSIGCTNGVCQVSGACQANRADCDGMPSTGCETDLTAAGHCGACTTVCGTAAPICGAPEDGGSTYTCGTGCRAPTPDLCGSSCTDLTNATQHCGDCATDCNATATPHTAPSCAASTCHYDCVQGYGDCDSNPGSGCETDLLNDSAHCGACGTPCVPGTHQTSQCVGGSCQASCAQNYGDCDNNPGNGCETDTTNTTAHCGGCNMPCTAAPSGGMPACVNSACDFTCTSPLVRSGSACVSASAVCPGQAVSTLQPGVHTVITGTTVGGGADLQGGNGNGGDCSNTGGAPDVIYQITPTVSGRLTAALTPAGFDAVLYARGTCSQANTQLACANAGVGAIQETLTLTVTAGVPVSLVVDGEGSASGAFGLDLLLDAACGDHVLDAGESCDDGNAVSGDGCEGACLVGPAITESCGGTVPPITVGLGQQIYSGTIASGNSNDLACTGGSAGGGRDFVYKINPTANGTLRIDYVPTGYDAVLYTDAACAASSSSACVDANGSGVAESTSLSVARNTPVYVYADSAGSSDRGTFTLTFNLAACGDGAIEAGEECDDGGATSGDGCSSTCQIEAGCDVADNGTNTFLTAQGLPSGCRSVRVTGTITPMIDEAAYLLQLPAGVRVRLRTYQTSPDAPCPSTFDPLFEVYYNASAAPTNATCSGSAALLCQDNASASNYCQDTSFVTPVAGTYGFRLLSSGHAQTLTNYKLLIQY